jgi:hypothetical protein
MPVAVELVDHGDEVVDRAEPWVGGEEVADRVAAVALAAAGVEHRQEVDGVDTQLVEVGELVGTPRSVPANRSR